MGACEVTLCHSLPALPQVLPLLHLFCEFKGAVGVELVESFPLVLLCLCEVVLPELGDGRPDEGQETGNKQHFHEISTPHHLLAPRYLQQLFVILVLHQVFSQGLLLELVEAPVSR